MRHTKTNSWCTLGDVAQIVGWFQIVRSLILSILFGFELYLTLVTYLDAESSLMSNTYAVRVSILTVAITTVSLLLLVQYILMGSLLLKACRNKDLARMRSWMIYEITGVVLWTLLYTAAFLGLPKDHKTYSFQNLLVILVAELCCVIVVTIHYTDLKTSDGITQ
ncbi:unnamed protein product, partial [Allacma fusca]